jgi:hypothetical protein
LGIVISQVNVTIVYAKLVVKLQGAIVAVALTSTKVQLGLPALSVSILKFRFTDGEPTFVNARLNISSVIQLHINLTATLVLFATSPIFQPSEKPSHNAVTS